MSHINNNACIHCQVTSCRHHGQDGYCQLNSVQITPCPGCRSGKPQDESMCYSYECL